MNSLPWDDLRVVLAIDRRGSLSGAAPLLDVSHVTVFRRLAALEKRCGFALFTRTPRGYVATAAGEAMRRHAERIEAEIASMEKNLLGNETPLAGELRVTTTDTLMDAFLQPLLADFHRSHPLLRLRVSTDNAFADLGRREADVAIRPTNRPPETMIGKRLGSLGTAIYRSRPAARTKKNASAADWKAIDWIGFDEALAHTAQARWLAKNVPSDRIVYRVDSLLTMVGAVAAGIGAAPLLCMLAERRSELERCSDVLAECATDVWLLMHPGLRDVPRVRALIDALGEPIRNALAAAQTCDAASKARKRGVSSAKNAKAARSAATNPM